MLPTAINLTLLTKVCNKLPSAFDTSMATFFDPMTFDNIFGKNFDTEKCSLSDVGGENVPNSFNMIPSISSSAIKMVVVVAKPYSSHPTKIPFSLYNSNPFDLEEDFLKIFWPF